MEEFNILTLSYIIPIFSLMTLIYRFFIFKYWDVEIVVFGIVLGWIPVLNLLTGLAALFCFFGDLSDTSKAWQLEGKDLENFAIERVRGGWEY